MARKDAAGVEESWHRNPWVWLIIAIPALTVAGCLATVYLALTRPDHLVSDYADASEVEQVSGEPAT